MSNGFAKGNLSMTIVPFTAKSDTIKREDLPFFKQQEEKTSVIKTLHNQPLGNQGERLVQQYFERKGFTLAHANWRKHGIGELDLIMLHPVEQRLLIIEVKARTALNAHGQESELKAAFSPKKQARLQQLTEAYLAENPTVGNFNLELLWVTVQGSGTEGTGGASITCYPLVFE